MSNLWHLKIGSVQIMFRSVKHLQNRLAFIAAAGVFLSSCGSRLPVDIEIKRPVAEPVEKVDLGLIEFTEIESGATVNVGDWMRSQGINHLLLTFGSKSCSACNKKARELRDRFLNQDQMALVGAPSSLALIGVNTDSGSLQLTRRFVSDENFQFIKWSDPRGDLMVKWFLPAGRYYGVPLTVMLNREGILWRYTNESPVTVEEIVARAITAAGSDANNGGSGDGGGGGQPDPVDPPTPVDPVVSLPPALAFPGPERMRDVMVANCVDPRFHSSQPSSGRLSELLPLNHRVTFIHVERNSCGDVCLENREILARKVSNAVNNALAGELAAGFLFADQVSVLCPDAATTQSEISYFGGGDDFFSVFSSHFDWDNGVIETSDGGLRINPISEAITLGFNASGELVYSNEGAIDERHLTDFIRSLVFSRIVRPSSRFVSGPLWNWFGMQNGSTDAGSVTFDVTRSRSKYSIINIFGESCGSCLAEMNHWSRPRGLFDVCADDPDFCQVISLENGLPDVAFNGPGAIDPMEMQLYLQQLRERMSASGISLPFLALDPYSPVNDDGFGYLKRFFDGYLSARNPELGFDFRSVIYDREGKILGVFRATPPEAGHEDHVEEFLNRLRQIQNQI